MVARKAYGSDQFTCDCCSTQRALQVTVTTLMRNPTFRAPLLDVPRQGCAFPIFRKECCNCKYIQYNISWCCHIVSQFNVNKYPTRCNCTQIFIHCKVTLHVSGVAAPIIRSTKNCNRNLRYRYSYFPPTWPAGLMGAATPETWRVTLQWVNICVLLHLVGFLLTLNCDTRNHELKKCKPIFYNFASFKWTASCETLPAFLRKYFTRLHLLEFP